MRRKKKYDLTDQIPQPAYIRNLSHDGRGIADIASKTTFISGALLGENVLFTYTKKHSRFDEGKISEVIQPSVHRVTPKCAHFGTCGGCSLQHLDTTQQILLKQQTLLEQLQHFAQITPTEVVPPLQGISWEYRRKARLGVRYVEKKQKMLVGFREKDSRYLADIDQCEVLHPSVGQLITPLKDFLTTLEDYQTIPQIEVSIGDDATALIVRHLDILSSADQDKLRAFAQQHQLHIYLQPGNYDTVHKLWPEDQILRLSYRLPDQDLTLRFHPTDFVQVNADINRRLVTRAMEWLKPEKNDIVLDLFCGLGNFSLPLAQLAKQVIGVEGDKAMVERAAENALYNQITNATFYAANLMEDFSTASWAQLPFNKLLIDPPRTGAKEVIAQLPHFKHVTELLYISCNPATLARDAGDLAKQGFILQKVGVIDMFPHTAHVESMALFRR